jgi:hypothetical protein
MKDHSRGLLTAFFRRHKTVRVELPNRFTHTGRADALKILSRHHAAEGLVCGVDGDDWPCAAVRLARTVVPIRRHLFGSGE